MDYLKLLYATEHSSDLLLRYLEVGSQALNELSDDSEGARLRPYDYKEAVFQDLAEKYSSIPQKPQDPAKELRQIISDLFVGVPRWGSPQLQVNVGTATNSAATAAYALALQENVINVNSVLSGNTVVAEHAVTSIMAGMARLTTKPFGIFTYGGSGTNLYALKLGLRKACPDASKEGLREKVRVFTAEDAHFSQATAADWLGVGVKHVVPVKARSNRATDLADLSYKLRTSLDTGYKIGAIYLNGGTTFNHTVDDIKTIVALRDRLVQDYKLAYRPHIHVDTVIGWSWLPFYSYDWITNPLHISLKVLKLLKAQYDLVRQVRLADSWGIDFHKAIGSCPVSCSMLMINRFEDAMLLSRKASTGVSTHQLAEEYKTVSPMQYTLENSRPSGAPLAALVALRTLGKQGYQRNLANFLEQTNFVREQLRSQPHMQIANEQSLGFVLLLRLIPPGLSPTSFDDEINDRSAASRERTEFINRYTKEFFSWDTQTRIQKGKGFEYSFTDCYFKTPDGISIYALKLYPASPFYSRQHAQAAVDTLLGQERIFREDIWPKK